MKRKLSDFVPFLIVIILILIAGFVNDVNPKGDLTKEDIYYTYKEGERLTNGVNPYERILKSDMLHNDKYATYFPLFYEVSFVSMKLGIQNYTGWLNIWINIFNSFDYAIALLLFIVLAENNLKWVGVAVAGFWLFNRWTLYLISVAGLDFFPLFFMVAALVLYPKRKWLAMLFFSISLGLKQFGIFAAPLFLIWAYTAEDNHCNGIKQALKSAVVVASAPFIASIPFLFWDLKGFIKSILFSATRVSSIGGFPNSVDALLGWDGLSARIPMIILILAVYWMAAKGIGKIYLPVVLIYAIVLCFNTVFFIQYMVWLFPFVPLLILEYVNTKALPSPVGS